MTSPGAWHTMKALVCACILAPALGVDACIDWLEVDEGDEPEYMLPIGEPPVLPSEPALVEAPGPLVPRTPGLRVPLAGYWTRVRLDALDLLLPYSWISLISASDGGGDVTVLLRLEGSTARSDGSPEVGAPGLTDLRLVVPITLPPGTDASVIRDGFELTDKALSGATVALRTSVEDLWLVTPTRLRFDRVGSVVITGSIEGEAHRGARGQRARHFAAAFLALRAPDEEAPAPPGPPPLQAPAGGP